MANKNEILTGTIDDLLISIASGLTKAQRELSRLSAGGDDGDSAVDYAIPHLDFELTSRVTLTHDPSVVNKFRKNNEPARKAPKVQVMLQAFQASSSVSGNINEESFCRISGHFQAVPANAGKPTVLVGTSIQKIDTNEIKVVVSLFTALEEPISGEEVHFNIDKTESGITGNKTKFADSVVASSEGYAESVLTIDPGEMDGSAITIVIDAVGRTETIVYEF